MRAQSPHAVLAHRLSQPCPSLSAALAADGDHGRLLPLAGRPDRLAVCAARGSVRAEDDLHLVRQLRPALQGPELSELVRRDRPLCLRHRRGLDRRRDDPRRPRRELEAGELQLPVLRRRPAVDPAVAQGSGRDRWRRPAQALLDHRLPPALAHHLLPARRQRRLCHVRHLRHHRCHHAGRPRRRHQHPRLHGLRGRLRRPEPGLVGGPVGDPHGDRDHPDRDPVPLRRTQRRVLAMVESRPILDIVSHVILLIGAAIVLFPFYLALIASTHGPYDFMSGLVPLLPGDQAVENYSAMLGTGISTSGTPPLLPMLFNSLVMALGVAIGKIAISILSAFAIVFFRFPFRALAFWLIFITLMLPVEVRIIPTFKVVADLGMLNSYPGLIIPIIASATATFLFRQFFLTVPDELLEAARVDSAGPLKFFWDILLPLSRTNMAALFVILFVLGWNQYLWPLLVTTDPQYYTIVMGIKRMAVVAESFPQWNLVMAGVVLAMLPPVIVVIVMHRQFVKS